MVIVRKILCDYGVGRNKSKANKKNHNPAERRIEEIKVTSRTVIYSYDAPSWSWLLCMAYSVAIINCMAHLSLSWRTLHEAAYSFTPDVAL